MSSCEENGRVGAGVCGGWGWGWGLKYNKWQLENILRCNVLV